MELSAPEHFKALSHPTRQRLLFELSEPATISQLASVVGTNKGNVAHHLKSLCDAGLVVPVSTRTVRGGTERYYQRVATIMRIPDDQPAPIGAALQAVAAEITDAAPEPLLTLRHLRLTTKQAEVIAASLSELVNGAQEAGADQPRYGLLVGLYQQHPHS